MKALGSEIMGNAGISHTNHVQMALKHNRGSLFKAPAARFSDHHVLVFIPPPGKTMCLGKGRAVIGGFLCMSGFPRNPG